VKTTGLPLCVLCALPLTATAASAPPVISITPMPAVPIVETRGPSNFVNFDMVVRNQSQMTLRISRLQVSVYDPHHVLVQRRAINTDAFAPSIVVIGKQLMTPGEALDIFNPFSEYEAQLPLNQLQYSFCLQRENNTTESERNLHRLPDDCDYEVATSITPRFYQTKTALMLPLEGKIFVWEGHDFYAHHLRVPFSSAKVKALGIVADSNDFAMDFIYTDDQGRAYHDDPQKLENWYGYGKPIFAPGAGTVIAVADDIPDNRFTNAATKIEHPQLPAGKDPDDIGNFVLIDHRNGEFSLLVHMKPGSVRVRPGEQVTAGELVGAIGFAGDSIFPHLHYSLMQGPHVTKDWGIPAYFSNFRRLYGTQSVVVGRGPVDSGDFVERREK
jgi:peptidase M23-like protein